MSKMDKEIQKSGKNIENLRNSLKKIIIYIYIYFFFLAEKKNAIFKVFQYSEDKIQPELSSPARFRIQGGGPLSLKEDDGAGNPRV